MEITDYVVGKEILCIRRMTIWIQGGNIEFVPGKYYTIKHVNNLKNFKAVKVSEECGKYPHAFFLDEMEHFFETKYTRRNRLIEELI